MTSQIHSEIYWPSAQAMKFHIFDSTVNLKEFRVDATLNFSSNSNPKKISVGTLEIPLHKRNRIRFCITEVVKYIVGHEN